MWREREQEGTAGASATYIPFALWFLVFATFPSSRRREGETNTEREHEGIAGVSATYIPFALWFLVFATFPSKKKRRREKREYRVTYRFALWFASVSLRGVCVCVARERQREQEGTAGASATYIPFALWFLVFPTFPSSKRREGERDRERTRGNSGCIGDLHTFLRSSLKRKKLRTHIVHIVLA